LKVRFVLAAVALAACAPQKPPEAHAVLATVAAPTVGARVQSPLTVSGVAPGDWYFEAVFPLQLMDADGKVVAEAPARAQTDWTAPGDKAFTGELSFDVRVETPAVVILQEDMPGEEAGAPPREVRVPVVLLPAK
jgi:hypothetical protein